MLQVPPRDRSTAHSAPAEPASTRRPFLVMKAQQRKRFYASAGLNDELNGGFVGYSWGYIYVYIYICYSACTVYIYICYTPNYKYKTVQHYDMDMSSNANGCFVSWFAFRGCLLDRSVHREMHFLTFQVALHLDFAFPSLLPSHNLT